jgi:2-dehydro-3-deoxygluconokinase
MALGARSPATRLAEAAIGEGLFEIGFDAGALDGPLRRGYGGDAANTAVMAARLGVSARLCGRVGDDALGRLLIAFWSWAGVETGYVVTDAEAPTGIYVNKRTPAGHRFDYHRRSSAGTRLSPADVRDSFLSGIGAAYPGVTLALSQTAADADEVERRCRAALEAAAAAAG